MITLHSPADILSAHMIGTAGFSVAAIPANGNARSVSWPVYVNEAPPQGKYVPFEKIIIWDTVGNTDGSIMGGDPVEFPGLQIRAEAKTDKIAYAKLAAVANLLSGVYRQTVTIDATNYRIQKVHRTSNIAAIGPREDSNEQLVVWNGTITVEQI